MLAALTALKSKVWRYLAVIAVTVGVLFGAYRAGSRAERAKQTQRVLDGVKKKQEIDNEVARLSPDARRRELGEWMSDGK